MNITNELKTRKIGLVKLESVKVHYPSHRFEIHIQTEDIQAKFNNNIWLSEFDIEKFLDNLSILDKDRKGQAKLESMSPGEFQLIFKAIDGLGHLAVICQFMKEDRINNDYSQDVKIEFQIDPTSLNSTRIDFLDLIK